MILAFGRGRAGNLMFQLGGISASKDNPREKLLLVNFYKLKQIFPTLGHHAALVELPERFIGTMSLLETTLNALASFRLIGSIRETFHDSTVLVRKNGILRIALFRGGWCQSEKVIDSPFMQLLCEESLRESVETSAPSLKLNQRRVCFVHVRRGDFVNFPSAEYSAALPACWYREQISRIAKAHPGIVFRFFSDDMAFVKSEFRETESAEFYEGNNRESFLLMASSDDGILSASTYSWWAGYFAHSRSHGTFIAPYFWSGWRLELWHPYEQIKTSFLQYQRVDCAPV